MRLVEADWWVFSVFLLVRRLFLLEGSAHLASAIQVWGYCSSYPARCMAWETWFNRVQ